MNRPFTLVTPERLQIREGGGCMSVFGLPFFGAGVFLFLSLLGIIPVSNADTRDKDAVTIVIPLPRTHWLWLAAGLIPLAVLSLIGPGFARFFRDSKTPDPIGWIALGFLTLFFGVFPMMTALNAFVRSRRGATIVEISKQGIRIRQRGAWTTRTTASLDASDILDIDYSSRDTAVASATRAVEQQVRQSYPRTPTPHVRASSDGSPRSRVSSETRDSPSRPGKASRRSDRGWTMRRSVTCTR